MTVGSYLGTSESFPRSITDGTVLREPYQSTVHLEGAGTMGPTAQVPAWFPEISPASLIIATHL